MKKFVFILLSTLLLVSFPGDRPAAAVSEAEVRRHDIRVVLVPEESSLRATDTLTVAGNGAAQIDLYLSATARIDEVAVDGETTPYRFAGNRLSVTLPRRQAPDVSLRISYRAVYNDPVPQQPMHSEDPTYGVAATIAPQGTFLSGSAGWYPHLPGGTSFYRIRLEAPRGTEGVTSAQRVAAGEEDGMSYSVWETSYPLPSITVAAGPYQVRMETARKIPIYTFFRADTSSLASTYLEAAKGYLELYQELFGPYPFEKFAVVENFFPTGYGFPSWTLLGSTVVRLPFIVETSLGHEIAHSWWGTGVRVDYDAGNWSEGLTTYVADHLYRERAAPEEAVEYRRKILRDYSVLVSAGEDFPLAAFGGRTSAADQAVGYGKAAMVFHMLRRQVGDEAFWGGLRSTARERMFQKVSWSELIGAVGKEAKVDLTSFISQWVQRKGAPDLRLEGVRARRNDDGWTVTGRLRQQAPFFSLPVLLRLENGGESVESTLELQEESASFILQTKVEPLRLIADPGVDLFRRLDSSEIPPTVNGIRGARNLLVVVSRDLSEETAAAAATLLLALRQEGVRVLPEGRVSTTDLKSHDLLYLGFPVDTALQPALPESLYCEAASCKVAGESFSGTEIALFAALPHPADQKRAAAVFLPFSADAALASVRKIPHYGKYSYLVFAAGENRLKGIWPAAKSPLVHHFKNEGTQK